MDRVAAVSSRARMRLVSDERLLAAIRRGERAAFEALYDRHSRELLAFSVYMLGSRQDGEDAVQATFAAAYRALRADTRPVRLRPWLFTIARNECVSLLRRRRETVELNGEVATTGDPVRLSEIGETVRNTIADILDLPEEQRAALVLAEVHGLSHVDIASVLKARPEQVKAYIYQARSHLLAERDAREADCHDIRREIADARGAALLRSRLRRHLRSCEGCREYANSLSSHKQRMGALLPILAPAALRHQVLEDVLGSCAADPVTYANSAAVGATMAGTAVEVASGGIKALAVKVAAGVVALGASAGVGVSVLSGSVPAEHSPAVSVASEPALTAAVVPSRGPLTVATLGATQSRGREEPGTGQTGSLGAGKGNQGTGANPVPSPPPADVPSNSAAPTAGAQTTPEAAGSIQHGHTTHTPAEEVQEEKEDQAAVETHQLKQREREELRQERQAVQEAHERERSEREALQAKRAEERKQRDRERQEEHHPIGVSRAPESEEERKRKRAEHRRQHEERLRKRQEERERKEHKGS